MAVEGVKTQEHNLLLTGSRDHIPQVKPPLGHRRVSVRVLEAQVHLVSHGQARLAFQVLGHVTRADLLLTAESGFPK
jgi:hypothetical protein